MKTAACPRCGEAVGPYARGATLHARIHDLEPEVFALEVFHAGARPTCECGCGQAVRWRGWDQGFARFVKGHMSDASKRQRAETLRDAHSAGRLEHWTRTRADAADITAAAGKKISETLKSGFSSGRISQWSSGHTAKTDPRIKQAAQKRRRRHETTGIWPRSLSNAEISPRLAAVLGDSHRLIGGLSEGKNIHQRDVDVECTRCALRSTKTVYSVIRHRDLLRCQRCDRRSTSQFEQQVLDFVRTIMPPDRVHARDTSLLDGHELDVLVFSGDHPYLAIECDGLYWHSDAVQHNSHQHQFKTDRCKAAGVQLMHIFEDDWTERRPILESMIRARLGLLQERIDARRCELVELDRSTAAQFFDENHIDGRARSIAAHGLMNNGELVAAMALRRPLAKGSSSVIEMARFAVKKGSCVRGALGRLTKNACAWIKEKHTGVDALLAYVDERYGDGHSYERIGFKLRGRTTERFWWTDCTRRFDRLVVRANKRLGLTERDVAVMKRVFKIHGCANRVYELRIP